jgi:hypothetical protein
VEALSSYSALNVSRSLEESGRAWAANDHTLRTKCSDAVTTGNLEAWMLEVIKAAVIYASCNDTLICILKRPSLLRSHSKGRDFFGRTGGLWAASLASSTPEMTRMPRASAAGRCSICTRPQSGLKICDALPHRGACLTAPKCLLVSDDDYCCPVSARTAGPTGRDHHLWASRGFQPGLRQCH